ncbi:hypothetical protein EI94DRAFT_1696662 [Lactarius quietus]|nr:hypothetical protein EI94DRAFT_1696662 [Lactarius quietus]
MSASPPPSPPPALPPAHTQQSLGLDTPPSQQLLMPIPQHFYGPLQTLRCSHVLHWCPLHPPFGHLGDIRPWGYNQYPSGTLPGVLPHPNDVRTHHALAHVGVGELGVAGQPLYMPVDPPIPRRIYPNDIMSEGVWIFPVEIYDTQKTCKMVATTDMSWKEFKRRVVAWLDVIDVHMNYQIISDTHTWMELACEADYEAAMLCVGEKALVARTQKVGMEIKNVVETWKPVKKDKRTWQDDIPLPVVAELKDQLAHLTELQVYCYIEPMGKGVGGGHRQLSNGEMTLWVKYIVQERGLATKHSPPNIKTLDYPPTKKARVVANAPSGVDEGVKEEIIKMPRSITPWGM